MKKIGSTVLIFILSVTIMGCSQIDKLSGENEVLNDEKSQLNLDILSQMDFISEYQIIDSILVDDNTIPYLKAIALFYDQENNNNCNLAFITQGESENNGTFNTKYTIQPINFAANKIDGIKDFEIADESKLSYEGNGAATISIRNIETNKILDYTIIYSYDESISQINFEIISDENTN